MRGTYFHTLPRISTCRGQRAAWRAHSSPRRAALVDDAMMLQCCWTAGVYRRRSSIVVGRRRSSLLVFMWGWRRRQCSPGPHRLAIASKFPQHSTGTGTRIELTSHLPSAPTIQRTPAMSREKRPANDAFGSSQLVKRAKPDATDSTALTVANGTAQNGALIQAVRQHAQSNRYHGQGADRCNRCREPLHCSRPSWS